MSYETSDHSVIGWAERNGLRYYYAPEQPSAGPRLRVHLGHVTADFHSGKLVGVRVQSEGRYLNDAFRELTLLFELCGRIDAYLEQESAVTWAEQRALFGHG